MEADLHLLQSPLKTTTFRMRFVGVLDQLLSVKSKNFDLKNLTTTTTTTTTKSQQTSTQPSSACSLQAATAGDSDSPHCCQARIIQKYLPGRKDR